MSVADLRLMYNLLCRVPDGVDTMCACLSVHLHTQGDKLMTENAGGDVPPAGDQPSSSRMPVTGACDMNPVAYIQALLDLKAQYDNYLSTAFSNDAIFKRKIQADFEYFVSGNVRSAEFMSLYIDEAMKSTTKTAEAEIETVLDKVMVLFRYLQEKDVFER